MRIENQYIMQKPKIDEATRLSLFSPSTETAVAAVQALKETGNKDYLPILFDLMITKPAPEVEKEILNLLATLKDKDSIPAIIHAIQEAKYKAIRKELTSACWQNGMDFSPYMEVFIDLIIGEEWDIAFEAFTVIENFEHFPPEEEYKPLKIKMAGALRKASEQKQYFLEEILKMTAE